MNDNDNNESRHYLSRARLSDNDIGKLITALADKSIPSLFAEFMLYRGYLEGKSPLISSEQFAGIRFYLDELVLKMAVTRAQDEAQLELKITALEDEMPYNAGNANLRAMVSAGIRADIFALKPARLPDHIKHWLAV